MAGSRLLSLTVLYFVFPQHLPACKPSFPPPLQALVTFFCAGLISCDPFHMVMPPLRSTLLLLLLARLPLPHLQNLWHNTTTAETAAERRRHHRRTHSKEDATGSSMAAEANASTAVACSSSSSSSSSRVWWYHPSLWWQQPQLRQAVLAAQRLVPLVAAAVAANAPQSSLYYGYTLQLSCWSSIGKYAYQGWMQYMLVVSLNALCYSCITLFSGFFGGFWV
jgi:hypothetical protein